MSAVLFVSNGHGEVSIAARIAQELTKLRPDVVVDHLALVGDFGRPSVMHDVGPRAVMPSGGLLAMGNLRNIVRDLAGGLVGLTVAQRKFLRSARGRYAAVVAVGDVYALGMALHARTPTVFVGTAKSVYVAPYGKVETRVLQRARAVFVRDAATARALRRDGVDAQAAGNVIVDLFASEDDPVAAVALAGFAPALALFPGSRDAAYDEGRAVVQAIEPLLVTYPRLGAAISIAPGLDVARFMEIFARDGWRVVGEGNDRIPFALQRDGRVAVRAWRGEIGPVLSRASLVIGQAGTANEAAAAAGLPVVALDLHATRRTAWYRKRQRGLLGGALAVVSGDPASAAGEIAALLDDDARRAQMGAIGRERMGPAGGAQAIARCLSELAA